MRPNIRRPMTINFVKYFLNIVRNGGENYSLCLFLFLLAWDIVSWFVSLIRFPAPGPPPASNLNLILVWKFAQLVSLPGASSQSGGTNWNWLWNWVWKGLDHNYGWLQWLGFCRLVNYRVERLRRLGREERGEESVSNCDCSHGGWFRHNQTINKWMN